GNNFPYNMAGSGDEVKLLGAWPSPYVLRVKIALELKGKSPFAKSAIILQYIDEVWAELASLLPPDPYDRAIARFWAGYIDDKWFPITREIIKAKTEKEKAEAVEQSFAGLTLLEEAYEKSYKEKPFFGGDNVGYLDIVLGSFLGWVKAIEKISDIKLIDGRKRSSSLAIVKELIPEVDKLVEFAKVLQAIWNANTSIN
ncbi:Glutathione S-transferase U18, partial [Ananas comosus]